MRTLVLDSGAFKAAETWDRRLAAFIDAAADEGATILLPATAVAEMWRNPPSNRSAALICTVDGVVDLDLQRARLVGALLGKVGSAQVVDADVVTIAVAARPSLVLTSDPEDLLSLVRASGVSCSTGMPRRGSVDVSIARI